MAIYAISIPTSSVRPLSHPESLLASSSSSTWLLQRAYKESLMSFLPSLAAPHRLLSSTAAMSLPTTTSRLPHGVPSKMWTAYSPCPRLPMRLPSAPLSRSCVLTAFVTSTTVAQGGVDQCLRGRRSAVCIDVNIGGRTMTDAGGGFCPNLVLIC